MALRRSATPVVFGGRRERKRRALSREPRTTRLQRPMRCHKNLDVGLTPLASRMAEEGDGGFFGAIGMFLVLWPGCPTSTPVSTGEMFTGLTHDANCSPFSQGLIMHFRDYDRYDKYENHTRAFLLARRTLLKLQPRIQRGTIKNQAKVGYWRHRPSYGYYTTYTTT